MKPLQDRLLDAHAAGDAVALVRLYCEAADASTSEDASGFYLTHAHVFALEAGLAEASDIRNRLIDMGRETAL